MRSFLTYGLISFVGVAALYACGDDSGDGSTIPGGQGGTGGSAGAGGGAGTAGAGGGGGGTGVAGSAGAAGAPAIDVSPLATCTGCVELIVPVSGANGDANLADQASFQFVFPAPGVDFSNGVITWHVQAPQNNDNFTAQAYAQNGAALAYANVYPAGSAKTLSAANFPAGTFADIVLDLSAYRSLGGGADAGAGDAGGADAGDAGGGGTLDPGAFDKSKVESIGLQLRNSNTFTGTGTIRVAVDGVDIVGVPGQTNHTFAAGIEGLGINNYQVPPGTPPPVPHQ